MAEYQSAAVMVLDHEPSDDELEDIAIAHLEDLGCDAARASLDVVYEAPDWMNVCERDQINAHMRDGGVCIVVVYMAVGEEEEEMDADDE